MTLWANAIKVVFALVQLVILANSLYADEIRYGRTGKPSSDKNMFFIPCVSDFRLTEVDQKCLVTLSIN
jgi:hypothetical protein